MEHRLTINHIFFTVLATFFALIVWYELFLLQSTARKRASCEQDALKTCPADIGALAGLAEGSLRQPQWSWNASQLHPADVGGGGGKSCYYWKSTYNKLYSCNALIHTCGHFVWNWFSPLAQDGSSIFNPAYRSLNGLAVLFTCWKFYQISA